ncbi:MAG: replicative DNA helicase [Dysgonamonadaceae bacterium]|jgi:replicative DNA helicase|nr:replicative DNA helicase [Dysgonamonadaceae bacterium]
MENKPLKNRNIQNEADGRILPRSIESERLVLGTIINNNRFPETIETLSEECFYDDFHRDVFRTIKKITDRGDSPDAVAVMDELKKEGKLSIVPYTNLIQNHALSNFDQHLATLIEKESRRRFFEIGSYFTSNAFSETEDVTEVMENGRQMIEGMQGNLSDNIFLVKDAITNVFKQMETNFNDGSVEATGTKIGLREFDRKSGGLQKSDLIIIAAETSQGKTSLALTVARNAAVNGTKIAFYSLEMKKEQLAARLMAMESGVPANSILYARLQQYQFERIDKSIRAIYNSQIYFDERSTSNIDKILSSIRTLVIKYGIEGVVVDYLQILNVNMKGANKEQQMGDVARRLKNMAKELDIWIIALSQLSRDNQNPIPSINRLRDSGQIAEAADVVILIYRPEVYGKQYPAPFHNVPTNGTALIDVAKGRNIGLLKFICAFNCETSHFTNLDERKLLMQNNKPDDDETPF